MTRLRLRYRYRLAASNATVHGVIRHSPMRDARRRNRNIGTAKSGHGQDNKHVVPERWMDLSVYWQKLDSPVAVEKEVQGSRFTFLIEPPLKGCFHFCTVEDICAVLDFLPLAHIQNIELVIFRQPTRRQQILVPVWGRLGFWSEISGYSGPGIYIEAQQLPRISSWPVSLTPDAEKELKRLECDGHEITRTKRNFEICSSAEAIRMTQLFRTIPHEVGHYVDYLESSARHEAEANSIEFWDFYDAKPNREKEEFAHRYADETCSRLLGANRIPFPPIIDVEAMQSANLNTEWFAHAV